MNEPLDSPLIITPKKPWPILSIALIYAGLSVMWSLYHFFGFPKEFDMISILWIKATLTVIVGFLITDKRSTGAAVLGICLGCISTYLIYLSIV